jgi:tetratricopeptide (TPR) repeat protein
MRAHVAALLLLAACNPRASNDASPAAAPDAGALDSADPKALLAEVDRLKDQLKDRPKTFEVLAALGNLYYENGRYLEAVDSYRQALALSAPAEAEDEALRQKKVKAAPELPAECRRAGPGYGLAEIAEVARKLDEPKRLRCLDAVLELALAARARRGNSLYLIGNPDGALAEHKRVLEKSPDYPESLFFVGAILLEKSHGDKALLEEGKKYWRRLLVVAPDHPRASLVKDSLPRADEIFTPKAKEPVAGGQLPPGHPPMTAEGALPPGHPPTAADGALPPGHAAVGGAAGPMAHAGPSAEEVANVADAVSGTERTPELEKGLDELTGEAEKLLDQGKYQEARDSIVRVMPMRPNDARTAADMGAAMRGLGRAEMAERVLTRALELDPRQPRALYEMGKLLAQKGDKPAAREKLQAAQAADAKFAQAHDVAGELSRLR